MGHRAPHRRDALRPAACGDRQAVAGEICRLRWVSGRPCYLTRFWPEFRCRWAHRRAEIRGRRESRARMASTGPQKPVEGRWCSGGSQRQRPPAASEGHLRRPAAKVRLSRIRHRVQHPKAVMQPRMYKLSARHHVRRAGQQGFGRPRGTITQSRSMEHRLIIVEPQKLQSRSCVSGDAGRVRSRCLWSGSREAPERPQTPL